MFLHLLLHTPFAFSHTQVCEYLRTSRSFFRSDTFSHFLHKNLYLQNCNLFKSQNDARQLFFFATKKVYSFSYLNIALTEKMVYSMEVKLKNLMFDTIIVVYLPYLEDRYHISLVMVITLVLLTSCDVMGLRKLWVDVWSALWLGPTMAPLPLLCLHFLQCVSLPSYDLSTSLIQGRFEERMLHLSSL